MTHPDLSHLLSPLEIGTLRLKNRMVQAPMRTDMADISGEVTQQLLNYYEERARAGVGLIMTESSHVDSLGSKGSFYQLGAHDDFLSRGLADLAERIKAYDVPCCLQINHVGRQRQSAMLPIVAPSPIPWPDIGIVPKELTQGEIDDIIKAFGLAAARAKRAGFDAVEIHGGHGYLICSFLSSDTNKRRDIYGGTLENRMRFALQVVRQVRQEVGPAFPVSIRISADEYVPGGLTLDETRIVAQELEKAGVDIIHVSAGTRVTNEYQIIPIFLPRGVNLHLAQGIKQAIKIPVIAAGALGDPVLCNQAIKEGKADLVSMARPLLAAPELPKKCKEGRVEEVRPCIRCNECVAQARAFKPRKCSVNFMAGKEGRFLNYSASVPKNVLVIGGGPAGMEAARVAALRGHRVTLVERQAELGGDLRLAAVFTEMKELLDYYLYQLSILKVQVRTTYQADATWVQGFGPDAVIAAVGGNPIVPAVPGIDSPRVFTVVDVFQEKVELQDRILVIGGDLIGCEVAWVLAGAGKQVTLVDERPVIPFEVEKGTKAVFLREFAKAGVKLFPSLKLNSVGNGLVEFVNINGGDNLRLAADQLVLALGFSPRRELIQELTSAGIECRPVGDCRQPARIMGAIHDGALAGYEV